MKHTFLPLFISMAACGSANSELASAKKVFESRWISNVSSRMTLYALSDATAIEIGQVSTRTRVTGNRILVITEMNMKGPSASWVDAQRYMVLEFGNIVTGCYYDKVTLAPGCFDSHFYPFLVSCLPLKAGYQQDIVIYDFSPNSKPGLVKASVQEVKSGVYKSVSSGEHAVWIVSVTDEIGGGPGRSTYYFDKTDRRLWKQEIETSGRKLLLVTQE